MQPTPDTEAASLGIAPRYCTAWSDFCLKPAVVDSPDTLDAQWRLAAHLAGPQAEA
jgi:hypothetical protein